jgi:hypothetical protein
MNDENKDNSTISVFKALLKSFLFNSNDYLKVFVRSRKHYIGTNNLEKVFKKKKGF